MGAQLRASGVKRESGESDEYLHQAVCSLTPSELLVRLQRSNSHDVWSEESLQDKILLYISSPGGGATAAVTAAVAEPPILFQTLKKEKKRKLCYGGFLLLTHAHDAKL